MNKKYLKHISTLFVVLPMSLIMAFIGHSKNHGFNGCHSHLFSAWILMLPVAYLSAFVIIQPAKRLAEKVCHKEK